MESSNALNPNAAHLPHRIQPTLPKGMGYGWTPQHFNPPTMCYPNVAVVNSDPLNSVNNMSSTPVCLAMPISSNPQGIGIPSDSRIVSNKQSYLEMNSFGEHSQYMPQQGQPHQYMNGNTSYRYLPGISSFMSPYMSSYYRPTQMNMPYPNSVRWDNGDVCSTTQYPHCYEPINKPSNGCSTRMKLSNDSHFQFESSSKNINTQNSCRQNLSQVKEALSPVKSKKKFLVNTHNSEWTDGNKHIATVTTAQISTTSVTDSHPIVQCNLSTSYECIGTSPSSSNSCSDSGLGNDLINIDNSYDKNMNKISKTSQSLENDEIQNNISYLDVGESIILPAEPETLDEINKDLKTSLGNLKSLSDAENSNQSDELKNIGTGLRKYMKQHNLTKSDLFKALTNLHSPSAESGNGSSNQFTFTPPSLKHQPLTSTPYSCCQWKVPFDHRVKRLEKESQQYESRYLGREASMIMTEWFNKNTEKPYPSLKEKIKLASECHISVRQVTAWFNNKRNRTNNTRPKKKHKKLEQHIAAICSKILSEQGSTKNIEMPTETPKIETN